jgi:hypothetical protein
MRGSTSVSLGGEGRTGATGHHDGGEQNAYLTERENGDHVDGERLRPERFQLDHALLHHHGADQKADQRNDRHGAEAGMVEVVDERRGAEAPGLADHTPQRGRDFAEKAGELDGVAPHPGQRACHVLGEKLERAALLELRPLGMAPPLHLLDEDAKGLGRASVAGAQTALLPGGRRPLQQHRARRVDLGDAGDIHLAGEVGGRRDRHAQALERPVELGGLRHGPGAGRDQAEGRAPELDAKTRRAGLGRQDNLMVALEHRRA